MASDAIAEVYVMKNLHKENPRAMETKVIKGEIF